MRRIHFTKKVPKKGAAFDSESLQICLVQSCFSLRCRISPSALDLLTVSPSRRKYLNFCGRGRKQNVKNYTRTKTLRQMMNFRFVKFEYFL